MNWKRMFACAATLACSLSILLLPVQAAQTNDIGSGAGVGGSSIGSGAHHSGYLVLNEQELTIEIPTGESSVTEYLYVSYAEDDYNYVHWSSSDTHVATVDNGAVTAWGQGTAIITAWTDTGATATCEVTVLNQKSSQLNRSYVYLSIEYNNPQPRYQLYLKSSDNGYDSVYQWRSSNPNVATVDRNGVVTAVSEGNATIYARTVRGMTLSCKIVVENNIGRITLSDSRLYLESMGAKGVLTASVAVADSSLIPITWTSSNPAVAVVDPAGIVMAVSEGEAIITATTPEGRSDTCKVYTGALATQKRKEAERFFGLGGLFQDIFE